MPEIARVVARQLDVRDAEGCFVDLQECARTLDRSGFIRQTKLGLFAELADPRPHEPGYHAVMCSARTNQVSLPPSVFRTTTQKRLRPSQHR